MSKKTRKRLVSNKRLMLIKNFYLNKYKHCDKDVLNAIDHFFSQKKTEEVFLFMLNNFDDFFSNPAENNYRLMEDIFKWYLDNFLHKFIDYQNSFKFTKRFSDKDKNLLFIEEQIFFNEFNVFIRHLIQEFTLNVKTFYNIKKEKIENFLLFKIKVNMYHVKNMDIINKAFLFSLLKNFVDKEQLLYDCENKTYSFEIYIDEFGNKELYENKIIHIFKILSKLMYK